MVTTNIEYINSNIIKFISDLDDNSNASVLHAINKLFKFGNDLTLPLSKPIGHKMFELRITNPENIRVIYTFYNNKAWILHIFKKKSNKIQQKEIELVKRRLKLLTS